MYYNTPDVRNFERFVLKNRIKIIFITLFLSIIALFMLKPQLVSSEDFFWLKESQEMQKTLNENFSTQYISRLGILIDNFDAPTIKKVKTLLSKLQKDPNIRSLDSLFSQKRIINEGVKDSNMLKAINLSTMSDGELKSFIHHLPARFSHFVAPHRLELYFYIYSKKPLQLDSKLIDFEHTFSQPNTKASIQDYLIYIFAIIFSIVLLFRLIFKNYFSSLIAFIIIFTAFVFTAVSNYFITGMPQIHIAMPLIIIAISLVDYLYFYYRWHVSQYKADMTRAMQKTLNRNLYPAMWTTFITIVSLAGLFFVDSVMIQTLTISIMCASLFTYLLNIFFFPALASFFTVQHPKVAFGRFCYFFANQEIHYNPRYLIIFLITTLLLTAIGAYQLMIDKKQIFKISQNSGIISANFKPITIDLKNINTLLKLEHQLQVRFSKAIKIDSLASTLMAIHHANYPHDALNDENLLEAEMYMDMYDLQGLVKADGTLRFTVTFDPQKVQKEALLAWLKQHAPFEIYFTDIDSMTTVAKDKMMHTLTLSLATAMLLIGLIMSRIFRSKQMALIGFIVNATPIVWLGLFIQIFHLPFTFEVLVAMSIALALGSDATIHFAYKFARSRHFGRTQKHSLEIMFFYGGIPVIIGSLVLGLAFLILTMSSVYTLELIGIYGFVLISLSLLTDLLILPVFLLAFDKYK